MTIALTGASGNLGRLVIEELLSRGVPSDQVVAIVRDPSTVADFAERGVVVRQGDYSTPETWPAALDGVDRLLLISISGPGASAAHQTVINAAVKAGVSDVVYTSIINATTTTNPLAPEHARTEELLAASGLPATILRNSWYHEFYTRALPGYFASGKVEGSTGEGRVSGAARADFAAAAAAVLTADHLEAREYELGGTSFTLAELAQTITEVSGVPITHSDMTPPEHLASLRASGMDPDYAALMVQNDTSIADGHMETDSTDLAQLVGRDFRSLKETIAEAIAAHARAKDTGKQS